MLITKIVRVVTLADILTIHNHFLIVGLKNEVKLLS